MGITFFAGIGRNKFIWTKLNADEQSRLKRRLAGYGDIASDHDLECFLRYYQRCNIELVIYELLFMLSVALALNVFNSN
jgi:hypothetical protein